MKYWFLFVGILLLSGCNRNVTAVKNYKEKINTHQTIAILPFEMVLNLTKGQQEILSEKDKAALSQTLALDLQQKLYLMLEQYAKKHTLSVSFQNAATTTEKLAAANTRFSDLHHADKTTLLNILGVDAVLDPRMVVTQQGVAFSAPIPVPVPAAGGGILNVRNLHISFDVAIKDHIADSTFWYYNSSQWYQAANKIKKDKITASNNFLAPLFVNIEDIFKAFIKKQPYQHK